VTSTNFQWHGEEVNAKLHAIIGNRVKRAGGLLRDHLRVALNVLNPYKVIITSKRLAHIHRSKASKEVWRKRKMVAEMRRIDNG
jgi:hypothetical protein